MSLETFRAALGSKLGEVITPELAAWLEANAFDRGMLVRSMRAKVERLEATMCQSPPADCPVHHHFAPGVYARQVNLEKGTTLTGAVHKFDNLVIVSKGVLEIATLDGSKTVRAGDHLICKAGTKNAAIAIEDATWTNIFATDETDVEKLVEQLTESTHDELLGGSKNQQLLMQAELNKLEA